MIEVAEYHYPHQSAVIEKQAAADTLHVVGIFTGYGGGKTYTGVRVAFQEACQFFPTPYLCIEPTYPMIRDVMVEKFEEFFAAHKIKYRYNKVDHNIFVRDRKKGLYANIHLRSASDPDKLKGKGVCGAWMDEPFSCTVEAYKQVIARLREIPKGYGGKLTLTGTPEDADWGMEELEANTELVKTVDIDGIPLEERYGEMVNKETGVIEYYITYFVTSSYANHSLPGYYIGSLLSSHTKEQIESYVHGRFGSLKSGRCYDEYDPNLHVVDEITLMPGPLDISCDFNFSIKPMSWNIHQSSGGVILVKWALQEKETSTRKMCQHLYDLLLEHYPHGIPLLRFYGDHSGSQRNSSSDRTNYQVIQDFFAGKVPIAKPQYRSNPKVVRRINHVNAMLKNKIGDVRIYLDKNGTKPLQRDFQNVTWDEKKAVEDQSNPLLTHNSSALGYYINIEFPISKPTVRRG